ncbi:MAG: hypothetical protein ABL932_09240 [Terricaulis sp.]
MLYADDGMKSETEIWIEKLEAAVALCERLPAMSASERRRIENLMFAAGRFDLMVMHAIPLDQRGLPPSRPLSEFLREQEAKADAKR